MMVCLMSASYVIRAVVEEKDSRLVELLLVSVKPMALLAGKILAVMAFTFGWLLAMLAGFGVSCGLTAALMGSDALHRQLSGVLAALPQAAPDVWHLVSLLAVLSIFCAPVQFACGNVSIWLVLLSWLIQAAVIFGLLTLAARVYAGLIVHRGSRVKWREVFSMAKGGAAR